MLGGSLRASLINVRILWWIASLLPLREDVAIPIQQSAWLNLMVEAHFADKKDRARGFESSTLSI